MGASGECFRDDQAPCLHRLGGAGVDVATGDDRSVLDSDEYPTAGLAHPRFAARAHGVGGQQYASSGATIC